ncbi:Pimeloyl-[acyl-carrier protein] methyl ester esterase [Burkholderiales bacterium]|nr:Pimeloyl-[acyl-carrier protein] methyl ester esterase [Burkholderiales bacterium]
MMASRVPLLLLPGLVCDAELFAAQASGLADVADVRVADLTAHDTMAALADDALRRAPWPRFALGGLSMGGYVAYEILRRAPGRVAALALIDTSARPDSAEASDNRRRLMALALRDFSAVAETLLPKLLHPAHAADPRLAGIVRDMAARVGAEAFARQELAIIGRADSRPDLGRIACPAVVIAGRDDALIPPEVHEEQAAGIRGADLVFVDRCGHLATIEQPEGVNAALRRWLARVPG